MKAPANKKRKSKEGSSIRRRTKDAAESANLDAMQKLLTEEAMQRLLANIRKANSQNNPEQAEKNLQYLHDIVTVDEKCPIPEKCIEACRLGAHLILSETMFRWPECPKIQKWACFCIFRLSYVNANEDLFIECGVVEGIVHALERFPNCLGLQWGGCSALGQLISGFKDVTKTKGDITKRFVLDYGGIGLVLRAVKNYPGDEDMVICCAILFQNLAPHTEYRMMMRHEKVALTMGATLNHCANDSEAMNEAMECVREIYDDEEE